MKSRLPNFLRFAFEAFGLGTRSSNIAGMAIPPQALKELQSSDRFIISFPRSGNTWLRHLVHEIIVSSRPEIPRPQGLDDLQPTIHRGTFDRSAGAKFGIPSPIIKSHNIRDLRGHRMIYLFRSAADTFVSYFHLQARNSEMKGWTPVAMSMDEFSLSLLPHWCEHVQLALNQRKTFPDRTLFVSYERMMADAAVILEKVVPFLGLSASEQQIASAVERCSFERLKAREQERKPSIIGRQFFRKGRVGGGAEELEPRVRATIEKRTAKLYQRATEHAV